MADNVTSDASGLDLKVVIGVGQEDDLWRATLAVGGMTCAACIGAITQALQTKSCIRHVAVNLIANSATVEFVGKESQSTIVEAIEDIGYEATIDTVESLNETAVITTGRRTVEILVDGMFCHHCPPNVMNALEAFGNRVTVEKPLTMKDPILRISYTPEAPHFTIRNIISAISQIDALTPSVYHAPTIEERSRRIHDQERRRILSRVVATTIIAIPTFIIGIVYMSLVPKSDSGRQVLMEPLVAGVSRSQWALFILATPVYFFCANVFHLRALKEVRAMWRRGSDTPVLRRFYRFGSMNMLMSLGTSIAYFSSVAQLIAAGARDSQMVEDSSFYFDSVVFLTMFLLIGRLIEAFSKAKTGDAVLKLGQLRPTEALLVADESSLPANVKFDLLEFGDIVRVLHGGSPPCDGTIMRGNSNFDESSLTGESKLVKKHVGDQVYSGTINKDSPISIKITGVAGSSMLDQIVKAVREGQTRRAPMERLADSLTGYFVPFVTLIAMCTWFIWLALGYSGNLPADYLGDTAGSWVAWSLQFAIAVFVVACPCGLALAAPTALLVGGGLAAQNGILVKGGGEAFENASRLDCIVFDKTGTLTAGGEPVVTNHRLELVPTDIDGKYVEEVTITGMISSLEGNSSHAIAKALTVWCNGRESSSLLANDVEEIAGQGLQGTFKLDDFTMGMIIGNEDMLAAKDVIISEKAQSELESWKSKGKSVALAAISIQPSTAWVLAAIFAISDEIRPEASSVVRALQQRGMDVWMLSGDNQVTANAVAAQVGILSSNVIAGVRPTQKADKIRYLQKSLKWKKNGSEYSTKRSLVAMIGDGINDSPAITAADVGIAIGSGSDIAVSSAGFVLVSSNLNALISLLDLSKIVFRRIKFNFAWALIYNMAALPIAAGVLYPIDDRHIRLDPVWASLAMALSSISVVCSSLLLRSDLPVVGWRKTES